MAQGTLTVTPGTNATPPPLNVSLNANITSASVSVPSPDPSNTPNTQLFTAGVAATVPLTINAYDASGNSVLSDPTTPFATTLGVSLSGASGNPGFSLGFTPSCASSSSGTQSITIGCAGDLSKVTLAYSGSINVDSNKHIIDAASITPAIGTTAQTGANVAHAVLQSNILTYQLAATTGNMLAAQLQNLPDGTIAYLFSQAVAGWGMGTYSPATGTITSSATSTTGAPQAFAISADGTSIWVADQSTAPLRCFTSIGAISGAATKTYNLTTSLGYPIRARNLAFDASGNLWYEGVDQSVSVMWAGFIPVTSSCGGPTNAPNAQVALTGITGDYHNGFATTANGAQWSSYNSGLFQFNTTSMSASGIAPASGLSTYGSSGGIAIDASNNAYTINNWSDGTTLTSDLEKLPSGSGTPTTILTLPPGSTGVGGAHANAGPLNVFNNAGVADRLIYEDGGVGALGYVDQLQATPAVQLIGMPVVMYGNQNSILNNVTFTSTGEPVVIGAGTGGVPTIARVLATTTWNVPKTNFSGLCGTVGLASVLQRGGSSGPFRITVTGGFTANAFPAPLTSAVWLTGGSASGPFTITVTDASGRTRTFPANFTYGCT